MNKLIPFLDQHIKSYKASFVVELEKNQRNDFFKELKASHDDAIMKNGIITYQDNGIKKVIHLVDVGLSDYTIIINSYFINFFIGKMLTDLNLSLTPDGLKYVHYYSKTHFLRDTIITKDPKKIFDLVKIDYESFVNNKNSIDQIFALVKKSPYFDLSSFEKIEKINTIFIEDYQELIEKEIQNNIQEETPLKINIEDLDPIFPGFLSMYQEWESEREKIESAERKFNGKLVISTFPEFSQVVIGKAFQKLKSRFQERNLYVDYINKTALEVILEEFRNTSKEIEKEIA